MNDFFVEIPSGFPPTSQSAHLCDRSKTPPSEHQRRKSMPVKAYPTAGPFGRFPQQTNSRRRRRRYRHHRRDLSFKLTDHITVAHRKDRFRARTTWSNRSNTTRTSSSDESYASEIKGNGNNVTSVILKDLKSNREYEREFDAVFIFVGIIPETDLLKGSFDVLTDDGWSSPTSGWRHPSTGSLPPEMFETPSSVN